jgi:hypothetical protein
MFTLPIKGCEAMLNEKEIKSLSKEKFDLMILDGAFPECSLGIQYELGIPFIYLNTAAFDLNTITRSGSPAPYSFNPCTFISSYSNSMNFIERVGNSFISALFDLSRFVSKLKLKMSRQN